MLTRVEIENFLSFGERQTLSLEGNSNIFLVGENGAGKSNLTRAIAFAIANWHRDTIPCSPRGQDKWVPSKPSRVLLTFKLTEHDRENLLELLKFVVCWYSVINCRREKNPSFEEIAAEFDQANLLQTITVGLQGNGSMRWCVLLLVHMNTHLSI